MRYSCRLVLTLHAISMRVTSTDLPSLDSSIRFIEIGDWGEYLTKLIACLNYSMIEYYRWPI